MQLIVSINIKREQQRVMAVYNTFKCNSNSAGTFDFNCVLLLFNVIESSVTKYNCCHAFNKSFDDFESEKKFKITI